MFKNILVATDGSKLSAKAVQRAIDLAQALGARLTAFYASQVYTMQGFAESVAYEPQYSRKMYEARCKEGADKILGAVGVSAQGDRKGAQSWNARDEFGLQLLAG